MNSGNIVTLGNTAHQCRLGLFQDSDFAGDVEDSKSTGGIPCIFGSTTFVAISWMCKKQTSVSHSSTEVEIISLDTGLRMDGVPALTLWDLVIEVFRSVPNRTYGPKRESHGETVDSCQAKHAKRHPNEAHQRHSNKHWSHSTHSDPSAMLYVFEDNQAVIKMIIKGRSPTMRHLSRTHTVVLDWLLTGLFFLLQDQNPLH